MNNSLWEVFAAAEQLTSRMCDQFKSYYEQLVAYNAHTNLTAITDEASVIAYHFQDSLALGNYIDMALVPTLCDIGTGAGFPGLALKIKYPHLKVTLLEVNQKKVSFLNQIIHSLELTDVQVIDLDWRTFIRHATEPIALFTARASLQPHELLRIFRGSSAYIDSTLVYWASEQWVPDKECLKYLHAQYGYKVGDKTRRLIFFKRQNSMVGA